MNKSITTLFFVIIFFVTLPFKLLKIFFFSKKQDIKNHPYLNNNFAPVKQDEQFSTDFEIEGEIPNDLDGVFVRNGPNPKYPILENYHWFDGDGYLHEMELKGGKIVQYKGKYTKTQRLQNEDKAGKKLYPLLADIIDPKQFIKIAFDMFLNTIKGKKSDDKMLGTANTSVEYHANRFFALVESDAPYQVVLPELETLGKYDFEGKLNHPFTAHPKVDPVTNEMLFFGYNSRRKPLLCYSVVNKEGKLVKSVPIDVGSVPIMIHDFAVTENYSVFLLFPLELNPLDLINGKNGFDLNKKKPAKIAVIPRHGDTKDVRYFNISNGYVFHTVNAWEEGDKIHVYGCKANDMSLVTLGRTSSSKQHLYNPYLHRWVVDLKKGSVLVDECVDKEKIACEFPTIHPSLLGRKNRFCYVSNMSDKDAILFKSVSKVDLETNKRVATIEMGENRFCGEFVFVPKKNTKDEDDGYLLSFVHDEGEKISYFYIIDAREFKIAAKVKLQHRVPYGFHGKWVGRSQIESQIKTF